MSRKISLVVACVMSLSATGCAKPDDVRTVKSPTKGVFLTVETYNGNGPVDADDTRLYAHFSQDGASDKDLILEGEYLSISKLTWTKPDQLVICFTGGITSIFRNEVTLFIDSEYRKIHSSLRENC
ncbi:MAG TPA: hypothetical protein VIJ85_14315 [Rhizomicrobium sp.]